MATDKKHIAVYLDKAVEDALTEFCTANGLESKKGLMYSAAVNKALMAFFNIPGNTLSNVSGNTLNNTSDSLPNNTPSNLPSDIPARVTELENQFAARLAEVEERLGKLSA